MRNGFLFAACEKGDHLLYRFKSIGDKETSVVKTSSSDNEDAKPAVFIPRRLVNL